MYNYFKNTIKPFCLERIKKEKKLINKYFTKSMHHHLVPATKLKKQARN